MITVSDIASFLNDFKIKMDIWGVLFRDDRNKNFKTLIELELRPIDRKEILKKLETKDYSEGPIKDSLYAGSDMWVFGKTIKNKEVYIKISMGLMNNNVICISFHLAEPKMIYRFK